MLDMEPFVIGPTDQDLFRNKGDFTFKQKLGVKKPGLGCISPNKISRKYQMQIEGTDMPPEYNKDTDYYREFWRLFL